MKRNIEFNALPSRRRYLIIKAGEPEQPRQAFGKGGKPIDMTNVRPRGNPDNYPGTVGTFNHDSFLRSDLHRFAQRLTDRMSMSDKSEEIISPEKFHSIALSAGIHPHELALNGVHKDQMTGHPGLPASYWQNRIGYYAPEFKTVNLSRKNGAEYSGWSFGTFHPDSEYRELQLQMNYPPSLTQDLNQDNGHFADSPSNGVNLWHARDIFHQGTSIGNVAALQEGQYDEAQRYKKKADSAFNRRWEQYHEPQPTPLQYLVHSDPDFRADASRKAKNENKPWMRDEYGSVLHEPILGSVRGRNQPHWEHEDFMPWYIAHAVNNGADAIMLPNEKWKNGDYDANEHVQNKTKAWADFLRDAHAKHGGELGELKVSDIANSDPVDTQALLQQFRQFINKHNDYGSLREGFDSLHQLQLNPIVDAIAHAHRHMDDQTKSLPDNLKWRVAHALSDKGYKIKATSDDGTPIDISHVNETNLEMLSEQALQLPLQWHLNGGHFIASGIHNYTDQGLDVKRLKQRLVEGFHRERSELLRPKTGKSVNDFHSPDADYLDLYSEELRNATQEIKRHQQIKEAGDQGGGLGQYQIRVEPTDEVKKLLSDNGIDPEYLSYIGPDRRDHSYELNDWKDFRRPREHFNYALQNEWKPTSIVPSEARRSGDDDLRLTWQMPEEFKDLIRKHGVSLFGGRKAFMNLEKHVGNVVKSVLDDMPVKRIIVLRKAVVEEGNPIQFRTDPESGIRYAAYEPEKWANATSKTGKSKLANRREFQTMFNKLDGLSEGEPVGVRLNINFLKSFGVPVQSIHQARTRNPWDEKVQAYSHAVTVEDPTFDVHQKGAWLIKNGESSKFPMAAVVGGYVPTAPDMHRTDGQVVTFNPMRSHLFTTMIDGEHIPVKGVRGRVTVHGTRVYVHPGSQIEYWGADTPRPYEPADKSVKVTHPDNAVLAYYRAEAKQR